ncbi:hypothetical protein MNBD_NITROSPINAE02-1334 [hydrothermal vent metagenome]|uniref:Curli production assembly/transport component CsgG n=1 Tax=hydrothermal vent metagenome TaxID=652676 RepID=A0A3B1C043_9ZZZZ
MVRLKLVSTAMTLALAFSLQSCATGTSATVRGGGPNMAQALAEPANGAKARLAVVKFIDKSKKASAEVGSGMADMLTSALFNTNRFIMLDREELSDVISEQDFAAEGLISEATAAKIGHIEGADLLVFGAITEFEPDHIGIGGFIVGALSLGASIAIARENKGAPIGVATYKESHIAIDLKIVDAKTGRVVAANSVKAQAENWGGGVIGVIGGTRSPIGLGGFKGTGMEQAILAAIEKSVLEIVKNTPAQYYRVKETMDSTPQGLMEQVHPVKFEGGSPPVKIIEPETRVIASQEEYLKLLEDFSAAEFSAPKFDWTKSRLVAVFAGEQSVKGRFIRVEKAIHREKALEVYVREVNVEPAQEDKAGPDWPYDVVRIDDIKDKIKIVWY